LVIGYPTLDQKRGVAFTVSRERRFQASIDDSSKSWVRRALVNATRNDICPLLLVEAGYVGCPVISTRKFAIPEIIDNCAQDCS
jgi:glycosyltransferase involved in cell wall biosynthesis